MKCKKSSRNSHSQRRCFPWVDSTTGASGEGPEREQRRGKEGAWGNLGPLVPPESAARTGRGETIGPRFPPEPPSFPLLCCRVDPLSNARAIEFRPLKTAKSRKRRNHWLAARGKRRHRHILAMRIARRAVLMSQFQGHQTSHSPKRNFWLQKKMPCLPMSVRPGTPPSLRLEGATQARSPQNASAPQVRESLARRPGEWYAR